MMRSKLTMVFVCFIAAMYPSFSQEYKFGKVSKEELQEAVYPSDSSANAAMLYENKKVYYQHNGNDGFVLITEVTKRIKLYNKNGFDEASERVLLYKGNSKKERVGGLKAVTYNLIDNKIVATKLKKDGVFESEYSDRYDEYKFTMPNLAEGSIIEYKYKITSPFIFNMDRVYLQRTIPIKRLDVRVEMPEYFNFKKFTTGYLPINLRESSGSGVMRFTDVGNRRLGTYNNRTSVGGEEVRYNIKIEEVQVNNVHAFKVEPYSGNPENYISALSYELSYIEYGDGRIKNYSSTWEDVTKTIYSHVRFKDELKKTKYYEADLAQLLSGISDPKEKVAAIFNFVKKKVVWNKKYRVFTEKGVRKAYKDGDGNAAEINLMLTSMLISAGLKANPVLVNSNNRLIALFPTIEGFDYVIARVKFNNGDLVYLDATDRYGVPNVLPERVVKGTARVIAENGNSQRLELRPNKPSLNRYNIQYEVGADGAVNGKLNVRHLDYLAHDFRVKKGAMDHESKVKGLKEKYAINEITEYTTKGIKEFGSGVNERFTFVSEDQVEVIENEMFFSPLLFLRDQENIFKSDDREYPVDFGFGFSNMYTINIKLPEGYEVAEYPKSGAFKLPDNLGFFKFRSMVSNGTIQVSVNETINASVIPSNYYAALKEFYNQVIQKEEEQIVLKKV